jgi:hypothetical protein
VGLARLRSLAMQVLRVSRPHARMRGVGEGRKELLPRRYYGQSDWWEA